MVEAAKRWVAIFDGRYFKGLEERPSVETANAFSDGLSKGADLMGDNMVSGYVLPGDEADMAEFEESEQVALALDALKEVLR